MLPLCFSTRRDGDLIVEFFQAYRADDPRFAEFAGNFAGLPVVIIDVHKCIGEPYSKEQAQAKIVADYQANRQNAIADRSKYLQLELQYGENAPPEVKRQIRLTRLMFEAADHIAHEIEALQAYMANHRVILRHYYD